MVYAEHIQLYIKNGEIIII